MTTIVSIRKPFAPHARVSIQFDGESRTHQSFQAECDINNIMARYKATGLIEHVKSHNGDYSDLLSAVDYHSAMNEVIAAQDAFDSLPSAVRAKFSNSPAEFLAFADDPQNFDEMVNLGLAKARPIVGDSVPISNNGTTDGSA